MGKKRNKKQKKKQIIRQIKKAAEDGRISKKEINALPTEKFEKLGIRKNFVKNQTIKIAKDTEAKIGKSAVRKLKIDQTKPDKDPPKLENVLEDTKVRKNIYKRLIGKGRPLTEKINRYKEIYGGKTKESRKYLKDLKSSATQRMTIDPAKYGRQKSGLAFNKYNSLAEKYDKDKKRTLKKLSRPLTNYLKRDDDNPLNNFKLNKDGTKVKKIKFDRRRMRDFVNNESDLFGDIREAAGGLGVRSTATGTNRVKNTLGRIKSRGATSNTAEVKSQLYTRPKLVKG
jgi:hypothetical protein